MELYGSVSLLEAVGAHLSHLTQTGLSQREVAPHQVGQDLSDDEHMLKTLNIRCCHFKNKCFNLLFLHGSPVKLLVEQVGARALPRLLLPQHQAGPLWAASPETHTASAATVGSRPPPLACEERGGSEATLQVHERARPRRFFVSS